MLIRPNIQTTKGSVKPTNAKYKVQRSHKYLQHSLRGSHGSQIQKDSPRSTLHLTQKVAICQDTPTKFRDGSQIPQGLQISTIRQMSTSRKMRTLCSAVAPGDSMPARICMKGHEWPSHGKLLAIGPSNFPTPGLPDLKSWSNATSLSEKGSPVIMENSKGVSVISP